MKDVLYSIVYSVGFILFAFTAGGLGAVIPVKAADMGLQQTDFGTLFIFKGAGGFLGGLLGLTIQKLMGLHTAMSLSFLVIGLCSLGVHLSTHLLALDLLFLFIETAGMVMNICSTVCIFRLHKEKGEPWIKSLHFCYGIGAFVTPLLIGQFEMAAYSIYACLAVPLALFMMVTKERTVEAGNQSNPSNPVELKEEGGNTGSEPNIEDNEIPMNLDVILALFLMCGTGNQASYGGWITSYGTINQIPTKTSLLGASIFWMSMTVGRGLLIPLSHIWNTRQQLSVLITGILLSIGLCNLLNYLQLHSTVLFGCSIITGLFMSGIYPLTMSLPTSIGLHVTPKNTSRYVLGGCVGGALVPWGIGLVMKGFGPGSLFVCMVWVLFVMVYVFRRVLTVSEGLGKNRQRPAMTAEALNQEAASPGGQ